mmetsp:Transcript_80125/g.166717  ORF Transcript_80125/g.166717 Transcript_80125/m.166717 type:complete len:207 (-) Transcript_80125:2655-3275(-)
MSVLILPSGYFSAVFTRYLLSSPEPCVIRRRTISTARTTFLCLDASNIKRACPPCTSEANSVKVLAEPCPNSEVEMEWSSRVVRMLCSLDFDLLMSSSAETALAFASSKKFAALYCSTENHSNLQDFSARLSWTVNEGFSFSALWNKSLWKEFPFLLAAFSNRSTSSFRRSATPALAPTSLTSGLKSVSQGSCVSADDLMEAKKGC